MARSEIGFTILSMTVSLAAVFIPLLFMGGIVGRLLHEFAVTIGVAILVSGFVSLTLTPMLCSRFLKSHEQQHHGRFYQASEKVFEAWLRGYDWSLQRVLRHKFETLIASFVLIFATYLLYSGLPEFIVKWLPDRVVAVMPAVLVKGIPTGFIPDEDQGLVFAFTEARQGIAFQDMMVLQQKVSAVVRSNPDVVAAMSTVAQPTNNGRDSFA